MDPSIVAAIAVIISAIAVVASTFTSIRNMDRTVALARETRTQERLAESYLEVLRMVQLESIRAHAIVENYKIMTDEYFQYSDTRAPVPDPPALSHQSIIAAHLAAFGTARVRALYNNWRTLMRKVEIEIESVAFREQESFGSVPAISVQDLIKLQEELLPEERRARDSLSDAMGKELSER